MAKFSKSSLAKLGTCHLDLQVLFNTVIDYQDCTILAGHRSEHVQNEAFRNGLSKLAWPKSKHNLWPSMAVDVTQYPVPKWENVTDFVYFGGLVMGIAATLYNQGVMKHELRYGGDWDKNGIVSEHAFLDAVHFELIGES